MAKKMILLNASPRKNKNTAQMLESVMKGAQEAGAAGANGLSHN